MNGSVPAGKLLARGVRRYFRRCYDFQSLEEFVPDRGLRVDVFAVGPRGEIWIVECKSSWADYSSDSKWRGYLAYCDRFFWAVGSSFPHSLLPAETGLIFADQHDAEIHRMGNEIDLAAARRRKLTLKFARTAAERHFGLVEAAAWERFRAGSAPEGG